MNGALKKKWRDSWCRCICVTFFIYQYRNVEFSSRSFVKLVFPLVLQNENEQNIALIYTLWTLNLWPKSSLNIFNVKTTVDRNENNIKIYTQFQNIYTHILAEILAVTKTHATLFDSYVFFEKNSKHSSIVWRNTVEKWMDATHNSGIVKIMTHTQTIREQTLLNLTNHNKNNSHYQMCYY